MNEREVQKAMVKLKNQIYFAELRNKSMRNKSIMYPPINMIRIEDREIEVNIKIKLNNKRIRKANNKIKYYHLQYPEYFI